MKKELMIIFISVILITSFVVTASSVSAFSLKDFFEKIGDFFTNRITGSVIENKGNLTVSIVDNEGNPISNAGFFIVSGSGFSATDVAIGKAQIVALRAVNESGIAQVELDEGVYSVITGVGGYESKSIDVEIVSGTSINEQIILNPTTKGKVIFYIRDLSGNPIDSTNVTILEESISILTNSKGFTDPISLEQGNYNSITRKFGYKDYNYAFEIEAGIITVPTLSLISLTNNSIRIVVIDNEYNYIPNAKISIIPEGSDSPIKTLTTDEEGYAPSAFYFISLVQGNYTIVVSKDGYDTEEKFIKVKETTIHTILISKKTIQNCVDSDDGKNYYVAGNVTWNNTVYHDKCINYETLKEYVCEQNRKGELVAMNYNYKCPKGCKNGACINETQIITSSRGIKNLAGKHVFITDDDWKKVFTLTSVAIDYGENTVNNFPLIILDEDNLKPVSQKFIEKYNGKLHNYNMYPISDRFSYWSSSPKAIVVEDNYESAMKSALIAAYMNWPLLYSDELIQLDNILGLNEVIIVGNVDSTKINFKKTKIEKEDLDDFFISLLESEGDELNGAVLTNPNDYKNEQTLTQSLSLIAPYYAAYRKMLIVFPDDDLLIERIREKMNEKEKILTEQKIATEKSIPENYFPEVGAYGSFFSYFEERNNIVEKALITDKLKKVFKNNPDDKHLTIFGGPISIPFRIYLAVFGWRTSTVYTEILSSDVDSLTFDNDYFTDVSVGRIITSNIESTSLLVSKTFYLENVQDFNKSTLIAGYLGFTGMINDLTKSALYPIKKRQEQAGINANLFEFRNDEFTDPSINELIESMKNTNIISWFVHGDYNKWGPTEEKIIYTQNISKILLDNPIITTSSCVVAQVDENTFNDSIALSFLDSGAISFIGSTEVEPAQYGSANHNLIWNELFDGKTLGQALKNAKNNAIHRDLIISKVYGVKSMFGPKISETNLYPLWEREKVLYGDPMFKLNKKLTRIEPKKEENIVSIDIPIYEDWEDNIWEFKQNYIVWEHSENRLQLTQAQIMRKLNKEEKIIIGDIDDNVSCNKRESSGGFICDVTQNKEVKFNNINIRIRAEKNKILILREGYEQIEIDVEDHQQAHLPKNIKKEYPDGTILFTDIYFSDGEEWIIFPRFIKNSGAEFTYNEDENTVLFKYGEKEQILNATLDVAENIVLRRFEEEGVIYSVELSVRIKDRWLYILHKVFSFKDIHSNTLGYFPVEVPSKSGWDPMIMFKIDIDDIPLAVIREKDEQRIPFTIEKVNGKNRLLFEDIIRKDDAGKQLKYRLVYLK